MSKRAPSLASPEITLDPHAAAPLYRQLYERLRVQILMGRLDAGARLPSTRTATASSARSHFASTHLPFSMRIITRARLSSPL